MSQSLSANLIHWWQGLPTLYFSTWGAAVVLSSDVRPQLVPTASLAPKCSMGTHGRGDLRNAEHVTSFSAMQGLISSGSRCGPHLVNALLCMCSHLLSSDSIFILWFRNSNNLQALVPSVARINLDLEKRKNESSKTGGHIT